MRSKNDSRSDFITKAELADEIMRDHNSQISLWFDDRTPVVKALREKGIKVLQVADSE